MMKTIRLRNRTGRRSGIGHKIYVGLVAAGILLVMLISVFAPVLATHDPLEVDMSNRLSPPGREHYLGTDTLGRDVYSRVLYGGRQSLLLAVAAATLSMGVGLLLGALAGYFEGIMDIIVTTISNVFQGLPGMTFTIAILGILGPGVKSIIFSLTITSWVSFSRLVRGEVLRVKQEHYVKGERCLGAGHFYIILRTIIPNIIGTLIVYYTTRIGNVILSIASLSFLGMGIQPPTPDWGVMITDAKGYFRRAPHLLWAPGMCIIILSLCINLLGDIMRDKLDVKSEGAKEY